MEMTSVCQYSATPEVHEKLVNALRQYVSKCVDMNLKIVPYGSYVDVLVSKHVENYQKGLVKGFIVGFMARGN